MDIRNLFFKCYRAIKSLLRGHPLIIRKNKNIYKLSLLPSSIKNLNREVRNTSLAVDWEIYADRVVDVKKFTPFSVRGNLIKTDGDKTKTERYVEKQHSLIDITMNNLQYALQAPKKQASELITLQVKNLSINLKQNQKLYINFNNLLNGGYFEFQLPVTPMHGDFIPMNALMKNNKLFLIDWEYASCEGSIIFDWWFLKTAIERNGYYDKKTDEYFAFLDQALEKMQLSDNQFEAFGCMMHTVINMVRADTRKSSDFNKFFNRASNIVLS